MDEQFDLPVEYKGKKHFFKATLGIYGFTHKFYVEVNGQAVVFEPDEEKNYRAVINYPEIEKGKNFDVQLLKSIAEAIENIVH